MEKRKFHHAVVILGLIAVLMPGHVRGDAAGPLDFPSPTVEAEDPLLSLKDFVYLPGSAILVDRGHILALFENSRNGVYAVVVFAADCNQAGCTVGDPISYSIFDPWKEDEERTRDSLQAKNQKIPQAHGLPEGVFLTLS